jgi:hypothetical protein
VAVFGPAAGGASAAQISYGFDGGAAQGWQVANNFDQPPSAAIANPGGGNPGGHLFYNDFQGEPGACCFVSFFSPAVAPGALSANYGGTISFDFRIQGGVPTRGATIHVSSPQGNIFRFVYPGSTNDFQRLSAPFSAAGWAYCPPPNGGCSPATEAEMRAALSASTQVELEVDVRAGINETYSIDNFLLTEPPPPPLDPAPVITPPTPTAPAKKCKKPKKGKKPRKVCKRKKKKRKS